MTNIAKKIAKKKYTSSQKNNNFLFVQVYQMGAIQTEKSFCLNSVFNKTIRIGSSRFCDLYLPFERNACDLNVFKIGKGRAEIFLDPRLEGYLNTSQKFGELKEFTSPRDALGVLTSMEDPLAVSLSPGARGKISFFDFEIVFKIGVPVKEKVFKDLPLMNKNFLQLPAFDSPIEQNVIPLSLLAMACVFIPLIYWLLTFPSQNYRGLLSIPSEVTAEFIAPENMRLLPYIFGNEYIADITPQLAFLWVYELQARWDNVEHGKEIRSRIPFLATSKMNAFENRDVTLFQQRVISEYANTELKRKLLSEKDRFYSYLKKSPMLATLLSGHDGQSNYETAAKRLHQLETVDKAIIEYLKLEHNTIKTHYAINYKAKKLGIVVPPFTGQLLGRQPDVQFNKEFLNYKQAEYFASLSENSNFRRALNGFLKQRKENEKKSISFPSVTLSEQGLLYPYQFMDQKNELNKEQNFQTILFNAIFSDEFKLPSLPKPKAIIDLKMVQFVVYNKKEEVRSCYNSSLRKNPHLQGEVKYSWLIDELGKVQSLKIIDSNMKDTKLFQCIESRIKAWKFPKSKNGPSLVHFPFKFVNVGKD